MKYTSSLNLSFALSLTLSACGPSDDNGDLDGGGVCVKAAETEINCSDGIDDDCDGKTDCQNTECAFDPACSGGGGVDGVDAGPECGELSFGGTPLAIPDGIGIPYETSLNIAGFDAGQTLDTGSGFESVCVTMEHSYLRDLQLELVCPSGETMVLQQFLGRNGNEVLMGAPIDGDGLNPTPGMGGQYCWKEDAVNEPMLDWATANAVPVPIFGVPGSVSLPAGDYRPTGNVETDLLGCTLNGTWTIRAVDDWPDDNGYIFDWSITFSEEIIPDCLIIID